MAAFTATHCNIFAKGAPTCRASFRQSRFNSSLHLGPRPAAAQRPLIAELERAVGLRASTRLSAKMPDEVKPASPRTLSARADGGEAGKLDLDGTTNPLFQPLKFGEFELKHRVIMAPLTRCRAYGRVPRPHMVTYYDQRATEGGLIITEATGVSEYGEGYPETPGLYTDEQVEAWKPVVEAVHNKGGVFFAQLWHCGRQSHPLYQPDGRAPVSSTKRPIAGQLYTPEGMREYAPENHVLTQEELKGVVEDFRTAARNAMRAGFDGVELHGAHGYLIDQFLKDHINDRTDEYGGALENRSRLLREVVDAVTEEVGASRIGVRISPFSEFLQSGDSDPMALVTHIAREMSPRNLAYLHVTTARADEDAKLHLPEDHSQTLRKEYKGTLFLTGGFGREDGMEAIASGLTDGVIYGRWFISNPDLPKRLLINAPLTKYDRATFYTQDPVVGYTDYPFLDEAVKVASVPA